MLGHGKPLGSMIWQGAVDGGQGGPVGVCAAHEQVGSWMKSQGVSARLASGPHTTIIPATTRMALALRMSATRLRRFPGMFGDCGLIRAPKARRVASREG